VSAPLDITYEVLAELARATEKFPGWPRDPLHALAVLGEEYGELTQAVLQRTYDRTGSLEHVREEALQTAAMAIRFLAGLPHYDFTECEQVEVPR
jgi:NTP pyrophosphatase (non-canonical NTP hydrolase)